MKKISLSSLPIFILSITLLTACGGSVGSSTPTPSQPTTAVLTLSTSVTGTIPATTTINSYAVTITLPDGVTVKSTANPPETDAGVVTATGTASGAFVSGIYSAATGTFPGTVKVFIVKVDPITGAGFDPGEFCKVNGDITVGHYPTASDFQQPTLDDVTGFDIISQSTVTTLTGELSLTATAAIH